MEDFFVIKSGERADDGTWVFTISVNGSHEVFKGHFPGKPVVPGVMTLMMTRKCVEQALGLGSTRIASVKDAKYVSPIVPDGVDVVISFTVDDALGVRADVRSADGREFTKIRMSLIKE